MQTYILNSFEQYFRQNCQINANQGPVYEMTAVSAVDF